jgi:hypothetical protein
MRRVSILAVLLLCCHLARADAPPATKPAGDAAAQVVAVTAEYDKAMNDFSQAYAAAKTPEEQQRILSEKYPQPAQYSPRLLKIAQDNPKTPAAFDALKWIIERDRLPAGSSNDALKMMTRDFAGDPRAGEVSSQLMWSSAPGADVFLQAVIAQNNDRTAKGLATFALGRFRKTQTGYVREIKEHSSNVGMYESYLGKDFVESMSKLDADAVMKQAESLFEQAVKEYGDVKGGFHETLGKSAEAELFELRELAIGKVAPDIVGEDIQGVPMKLGDFRGKVVLLDFWGDW